MSKENKTKGIWIPIEIWDDTNLTVHEKLFFVRIIGLDKDKGCYANNRNFAEFFKVSRQRSCQVIKSLEKKKYILIKYKRNGKEITDRTIKINPNFVSKEVLNIFNRCKDNLPCKENLTGVLNKVEQGVKKSRMGCKEKLKDNNIYNNKDNNISIAVFDHWNSKGIIAHRDIGKFKRTIKSSLKSYTQDEIKYCIDNYSTILKDDKYFLTYEWTLKKFLSEHLDKFIDFDKASNNYDKNKFNKTPAKVNTFKNNITDVDYSKGKEIFKSEE